MACSHLKHHTRINQKRERESECARPQCKNTAGAKRSAFNTSLPTTLEVLPLTEHPSAFR